MARRDPLRTVLRLRRIREQQAEADVAEHRQKVEEARANLAERRARIEAERSVELVAMEAARMRALQLSGLRSVELVEQARDEVRRAVDELDASTRRWSEASAGRKTAERLSERRRTDAAAVAMRASHKSLDELVSLLRAHRQRAEQDEDVE
ncbi:MAG: flagellar FliJ family protein [Actinomycetota bacterium]